MQLFLKKAAEIRERPSDYTLPAGKTYQDVYYEDMAKKYGLE